MSHLKLVSYCSNNFDIGGVLTYSNRTDVADSNRVNEILSLYFQWQSRATTLLKQDSIVKNNLEILYDKDDLEPEYFWIEIHNSNEINIDRPIDLYIEIFNTAYNFTTKIEEVIQRDDGKIYLYFRRPHELKVYKVRQTPRRSVEKSNLNTAFVISKGEKITGAITEIGPNSIAIEFDREVTESDGNITILGVISKFKLIRTNNKKAIFQLDSESLKDYVKYFKVYCSISYPKLLEKSEVPLQDVLDMYENSGFFGKGSPTSNNSTTKEQTLKTWNKIQTESENIIEMVAKGQEDNLIGSSCLANAFEHQEVSFWTIHHLAVLTDPASIKRTTDLYLWRIEFLLGLHGSFSVCCWYDSKSKWIDRIWSKFHRTCLSKGAYVHQTDTYTIPIQKNDDTEEKSKISTKVKKIGEYDRYIFGGKNFFGGIGPQYLNASGFLNHVCFYNSSPTDEEILEIDNCIKSIAEETNSTSYRITVPSGTLLNSLSGKMKSNADRFCIFPSESLQYLLSSLMHSLAVMERKHELHGQKLA